MKYSLFITLSTLLVLGISPKAQGVPLSDVNEYNQYIVTANTAALNNDFDTAIINYQRALKLADQKCEVRFLQYSLDTAQWIKQRLPQNHPQRNQAPNIFEEIRTSRWIADQECNVP